MKILINNVGNRHLFYENKNTKENYLYNEKKEFRERTRQILANWKTEKDKILLNILSQYLENESTSKPDKIILFATDQSNEYNTQDTLYAAEIIKKILRDKYQIPKVEIIKIKENPSDENLLFPVYKRHFLNLHHYHPEDSWIFLDAGGTPQQKMVSKLWIPELHDNYQLEYLKNVEGISKQELVTKDTAELEKFFVLKNIKSLVNKGHYASALQLLEKTKAGKKAKNYIIIGKNRLLNNYKHLSVSLKGLTGEEKEIILQYQDKKPLVELDDLQENIDDNAYFIFGEFLARADFYRQLEDWNNFILNFQQSLEVLLIHLLLSFARQDAICLNGRDYDDKVNDYLKNHLCEGYTNLPTRLKKAIEISQSKGFDDLKNLLQHYADINAGYQSVYNHKSITGLDSKRNKMVHEGKGIESKNDIPDEIIKAFEKIVGLTVLNRQTYQLLNNIINKKIYL